MNDYYEKSELNYPDKVPVSSEEVFFGNGWEVSRESGKFYFSYVSGALEGRENKIEINKEDFDAIKNGEITFDQMCRKYNVN